MKRCSKCKQEKPLEDFYNRKNGKKSACKECELTPEKRQKLKISSVRWMKNNPDRKRLIDRRYKLKQTYGISIEDYNSMLEQQQNKCAIPECGAIEPGGRGYWHIDHCHSTGKVRGILCHNCNVALGYAKESIPKLNGMIRYLQTGGIVFS